MSLILRRSLPRTSQPAGAPGIDPRWRARGLKLAFVPSAGWYDAASGRLATQSSADLPRGVSASGATYDGNARAEFNATAEAANGLTIISVWRARATGYSAGNGTQTLISNRASSNTGWSYGRAVVAAGTAATGNLAGQSLTLQGVAQYIESTPAIPSLIDTAVGCRYSKTQGKVSWFAAGQRTSPDTTASTSPTVGATLVVGGQGPFSTGNSFGDRASLVLVFEAELTDGEISDLTRDISSPWRVFAPQPRRLWASAEVAGGSTGATGSVSGASASAAAGSALALGGATATVTGASASDSAGSIAAFGGATGTISGAAASSVAGSVTATGGTADTQARIAQVCAEVLRSTPSQARVQQVVVEVLRPWRVAGTGTVAGAQASAAAGSVLASGGASGSVPGASASPAAGSVTAYGVAASVASVIGAQASSAAGVVLAFGGARAAITGAQASAAVGLVFARVPGAASALTPDVVVRAARRHVVVRSQRRIVSVR